MDADTWIKVIAFVVLAFSMWIIGYICGRLERK